MNEVKLRLLKEILENEFSIESFQRFTREFFNGPNMLPLKRDDRIWLEYKNSIDAYYKIANYKDRDKNKMLILAVELKKGSTVERARSLQRNFISKVLDGSDNEAAIVAFYTPGEPNWRLSLVRLDYTISAKGVELDLTPAKRFSYLVGKNEPKHTAIKQLFTIFEDDEKNPTLDEIEEAFSVEKVTKDFFNEYKDKYLNLKEYLEKNLEFISEANRLGLEVDKFAEQFSKKLMGQIAFLYFLQKKGWLGVKILPENRVISKGEFNQIFSSVGKANQDVLMKVFKENTKGVMVALADDLHAINDHEAELLSDCFVNTRHDMPWGSGDKNFIRGLFDFCNKKTDLDFFHDYLEPFFYDALNTKRKNHYFKRFNCKIPFLNGGLFEHIEDYHWRDINLKIPNIIFSNKDEKGREADGILDIFDMYNFTMNEDEPLEKEVAIDPEMLGKIFENLLDVSDRKSKGAFYTPREIVHYMCQEVLINYLVNKVGVPYDDIKEFILYGEIIKDADSRKAVIREGGELSIRQSIYDNIVSIDRALENVKVADPAVGSGAFPLGILNEIVKARNNITEYIIKVNKEGKLGRFYTEQQIRSSRSEYKMKWNTIKNSIFAVDIESSAVDITKLRLWLSVVVDQEIDENNPTPHPLPNLDQNIMVGNSLIDEFEGIKLFDKSLLHKKLEGGESNSSFDVQMKMFLDPSDQLLDEMFKMQDRYFGEENESKKREIKGFIENIRDELIRNKLQNEENAEGLKRYDESLKNKTKPYFIWELEFARVFKENGGFDIVIGNPPYGANLGENIKEYLTIKYPNVPDYESSDYFVCAAHSLLNEKGVNSYIIPNTILSNFFAKKLRTEIINMYTLLAIDNLSDSDVFSSASVRNCILTLMKHENKDYNIKLISGKIKNMVYYSDEYRLISKENILGSIENWLNLFYQSNESISILTKISKNSVPLGKIAEVSQGLIPYDKYRGHSPDTIKNRIWHSDYKKDTTYKKELQGKDVRRYSVKWNGKKWISYGDWLAAPRKVEFFTSDRILIREITNPFIFAAYTEEEYYNSPSIINVINVNNICIYYLLGLINSKLMSYYHNLTSPKANKGLFPKILVNDVRNLPIIIAESDKKELLSKKVNEIITKVKDGKDEISKIDDEIDDIVYSIYNLNDLEINEIEKFWEAKI